MIAGSISSPLNYLTRSRNLSGLFIVVWAFGQNLSSGSEKETFSPSRIITTRAVFTTPGGGLPRFFISVIAGFSRQLTAYLAFSRAGMALARAVEHTSSSFLASSDLWLVFSSSMLAFCCSS